MHIPGAHTLLMGFCQGFQVSGQTECFLDIDAEGNQTVICQKNSLALLAGFHGQTGKLRCAEGGVGSQGDFVGSGRGNYIVHCLD